MISRKSSVLNTPGFSSSYFTPFLKGLLACLLSGTAITVCGADAGTADPEQALRPFQLALANSSLDLVNSWDVLSTHRGIGISSTILGFHMLRLVNIFIPANREAE